jgi:hypothetical protein
MSGMGITEIGNPRYLAAHLAITPRRRAGVDVKKTSSELSNSEFQRNFAV